MSAYKNVQVLIASGDLVSLEQWQSMYHLPVGSDKIGRFFSLKEDRFQRDLKEFGVLIVNAPLMMVTDTFRELWGKAVTLSSYNRTDAKQAAMVLEEEEERKKNAPRIAELESLILKEKDKVKRQQYLKELEVLKGKLRADTSPHVVKMAEDIDMKTRLDVIDAVPIMKIAAHKVNIRVRIGHRQYLAKSEQVERETGEKNTWTFLHTDVCPEFYAKGMPFHNQPHPEPWERVTEW